MKLEHNFLKMSWSAKSIFGDSAIKSGTKAMSLLKVVVGLAQRAKLKLIDQMGLRAASRPLPGVSG